MLKLGKSVLVFFLENIDIDVELLCNLKGIVHFKAVADTYSK